MIDYKAPIDADEFIRGWRDCEAGMPHKASQSNSYDRGYAAHYEREQVMEKIHA